MNQKQSKPVRARAIGIVGPGVVKKLEEAKIILMDEDTLDRLHREIKELRDEKAKNLSPL